MPLDAPPVPGENSLESDGGIDGGEYLMNRLLVVLFRKICSDVFLRYFRIFVAGLEC